MENTCTAIEEIVLRHSGRGMNILQHYLDKYYCRRAAERLLALERKTVLLTTGFYVAGHAETDGPCGTYCVALALQKLGYRPVIVTDELCRGLFEPEGMEVLYVPLDADGTCFEKILSDFAPVCLISIERCGKNIQGDYANMRGVSIASETAPIDILFEIAEKKGFPTIGVGDGGNEIGMGNVKDIIAEKLSLSPCTVTVGELIIATTSNWGAYALTAYLSLLQKTALLPSYEDLKGYLDRIVAKGCVDGVTHETVSTVDGFSQEISKEVYTLLLETVHTALHSPDPA